MKFNKLIFFLFISTFHFYSTAQNQNAGSLQFPYQGTYNLQTAQGSTSRDFNQVAIGSNTFSLQMNGTPVRSYRIISEFKGGFRVERVLPNGQAATAELEAFNVRIFSATEDEYFVAIVYPQGSEELRLVK